MLLFGRIWNTLGLWTRKAVEHCKQGLMGHTLAIHRGVEDSAESDFSCEALAQECSEVKNINM